MNAAKALGRSGSGPVALCFSGSGCLAAYQLGAARSLQRHGAALLERVTHIVGTSGGALVAAVMAKAPDHLELAIEYSLQCQNMSGVEAALAAQGQDAHRANRPELVVVTASAETPRQRKDFTKWSSNQNLVECLKATCHIPHDFHPLDLISPFDTSYKDGILYAGESLVDGGLAAVAPTLTHGGECGMMHSLVICPFAGPSGLDIAPEGRTSLFRPRISGQRFFATKENLHRCVVAMSGASRNVMEDFVAKGEKDCERFIRAAGFFEAETP
jgi:hypothetical protein